MSDRRHCVWWQIQFRTVAEGTCAMEREERWDKHRSRVATSRWGGKKAEQPEALTPSNPGHQRGLQKVLSEEDRLGRAHLDSTAP